MDIAALLVWVVVATSDSDASTVRVQCMEDCRVRVDGSTGLRLTSRQWEFRGVAPGMRNFEITGVLDRPLFSGSVEVLPARALRFQVEAKRCTLVDDQPLASAPDDAGTTKAPLVPAPGSGEQASSLVHIRCPEDCTVAMDARGGRRDDYRRWTFQEVVGGSRRLDVTGQLGRPLFSGFVDVPEGYEVTFIIDQQRRAVPAERVPRGPRLAAAAQPAPSPGVGSMGSRLHVRCDRPCTVYVDGLRRAGSQQGVSVDGLEAGEHKVEVKSVLNEILARGVVRLAPEDVEVFVAVGNQELKVTNRKPRSRE